MLPASIVRFATVSSFHEPSADLLHVLVAPDAHLPHAAASLQQLSIYLPRDHVRASSHQLQPDARRSLDNATLSLYGYARDKVQSGILRRRSDVELPTPLYQLRRRKPILSKSSAGIVGVDGWKRYAVTAPWARLGHERVAALMMPLARTGSVTISQLKSFAVSQFRMSRVLK